MLGRVTGCRVWRASTLALRRLSTTMVTSLFSGSGSWLVLSDKV
jgi:hypothetical protein